MGYADNYHFDYDDDDDGDMDDDNDGDMDDDNDGDMDDDNDDDDDDNMDDDDDTPPVSNDMEEYDQEEEEDGYYHFDDDDDDGDMDDDNDDDTPPVSNDIKEYDHEEEDGSKNKCSVMFEEAAGKLLLKLDIPKSDLISSPLATATHVVLVQPDEDEDTPNTHINHQSNNTITPAAASSISSQEDEETNKNDDDEQFSTRFMCSQCWKDFKSPKALAGHMRIHSRHDDVVDDDDASRKLLTRPICSKSLPSKKSLFGHMNCHHINTSSDDHPKLIAYHDPPVFRHYSRTTTRDNLTNYVPTTWSITDKRGRISLKTTTDTTPAPALPIHYNDNDDADDDEAEEEEEENLRAAALDFFAFYEKIHNFDAACNSSSSTAIAADAEQTIHFKPNITSVVYRSSKNHDSSQLAISSSAQLGASTCINIHSPNFSATTSNYNNSKHGDGLDITINTDEHGYRGEGKAVVIASNKRRRENYPQDYDQPDSRNLRTTNSNDSGKLLMNKKKKKNMKLMSDLKSASKEAEDGRKKKKRSYRCDICDKGFPSHQALGGHRSSHNKFKVSIIDTSRTITNTTSYNAAANLKNKDQEMEEEDRVVELHRCKICNSSSSADCSSQVITGKRLLDFDLNEMPPVDDD